MKKKRIYIQKTDEGYFYALVGSEAHGRPSFRLWVNRALVKKEVSSHYHQWKHYIEFPLVGAKITRTEKGNLVLRPDNCNVYLIGRHCGYRGSSSWEILQYQENAPVDVFEFEEWDSERGSLGISTYAFVSTNSSFLLVKEEADGRLYGDEPVWYKKYLADNGEIKEEEVPPCPEDTELCNLL